MAALLLLMQLAAAEIALAWGDASNGVAMRIERTPQQLRVHFRNAGLAPVAFAVGGATGGGQMLNFDIRARDERGRECRLADTTVGFVAGYVESVLIRLAPGAENYVSISLDKLRCLEKGHESTLRQLLASGHSVRVAFTATAESNRWARIADGGWTGTIKSGEIP